MSEVTKTIDEQLIGMLEVANAAFERGHFEVTMTMGVGVRASIGLLGEMFLRIDRLLKAIEKKKYGRRQRRIAWTLTNFGIVVDQNHQQIVSFAMTAAEKARASNRAVA